MLTATENDPRYQYAATINDDAQNVEEAVDVSY